MDNSDPITTAKLLAKAEHLFQAMRLLGDDLQAYRTGIATVAVHAAILMSDAILVAVTGIRDQFQNHMDAVSALESACKAIKASDRSGIRHLTWLLQRKTRFEYSDERVDDSDVAGAILHAERFFNWAYTTFKEVLRAAS